MVEAIVAPLRSYRRPKRPEERVRVLGETMDLVRHEEMLHFVDQRITEKRFALIAGADLGKLYLSKSDPLLRQYFALSDLVQTNSLLLILWTRLTHSAGRPVHRAAYGDWRKTFWTMAAARKWRVFYIGGGAGVAACAARNLVRKYPGLTIEARDGFYDLRPGSADARRVKDVIRAFKPNVLLVGLPDQEEWIVRHHASLPACAVIPVGSAFDHEAGLLLPTPRWALRLVSWLRLRRAAA